MSRNISRGLSEYLSVALARSFMYDDRNARMHTKQFCKYLNESDLNTSCIKNPHYRQYSTHRLLLTNLYFISSFYVFCRSKGHITLLSHNCLSQRDSVAYRIRNPCSSGKISIKLWTLQWSSKPDWRRQFHLQTRPERLCGPTSLHFNGHSGSFPGVKRSESDVEK